MKKLRAAYVKQIYADHNNSKEVKLALKILLDSCSTESFILNVGSGQTRIRPNIKNLDIEAGPNVDYVGSAESIPLGNEKVDIIITQEAFEHIRNAEEAL